MVEIVKNSFSWSIIAQALLIAAIVSISTGYVNAKILESKVEILTTMLALNDQLDRELRLKVEEVALRQTKAISQAEMIHAYQDKRIERMEKK